MREPDPWILADDHLRTPPELFDCDLTDRTARPFPRRNATILGPAAESRDNWFGSPAKTARATTRRGLLFDQDFPLEHQAALLPGGHEVRIARV